MLGKFVFSRAEPAKVGRVLERAVLDAANLATKETAWSVGTVQRGVSDAGRKVKISVLERKYVVEADAGEVIGTRGETTVRVVVEKNGEIKTAYPIAAEAAGKFFGVSVAVGATTALYNVFDDRAAEAATRLEAVAAGRPYRPSPERTWYRCETKVLRGPDAWAYRTAFFVGAGDTLSLDVVKNGASIAVVCPVDRSVVDEDAVSARRKVAAPRLRWDRRARNASVDRDAQDGSVRIGGPVEVDDLVMDGDVRRDRHAGEDDGAGAREPCADIDHRLLMVGLGGAREIG